jgi:hypothetical protein
MMFLEVLLSSSAKLLECYLKFDCRFLPRHLIIILADIATTYRLKGPGIRKFDSQQEKYILLFFTKSSPAMGPI